MPLFYLQKRMAYVIILLCLRIAISPRGNYRVLRVLLFY